MSSNAKLVLPVALGLSLVTVSAFVIYYMFKKDEEETDGKAVKTSRVNVIEVNVAKSIVPALIGRSGSNVKDIEKKTGALIHFKKFSDKEYDVCIIRGRREATQLAETMIHEFIKQQPDIVEDSFAVPGWAVGKIIGMGGENINNISHRSGARVKIEGSPNGDKTSSRLITIRGTKAQIQVAKGLIDVNVAQEKCRREIEQSRRSPRHATPSPAPSPTPPATPTTPVTTASEQSATDEPGDANHCKYKRADAVGSPIEVYVSAVSSPSRFWVQFVGPQVAQLDELVEHMTEYYGNKENREAHALSHAHVGAVVAAVFRHDGRWYRARVHDIRPNEFDATQQVADVFYLDYGDSEYVACHELCELRADLLRLRFQAMECFLAGVCPTPRDHAKPERWHPQAIERFEELAHVARWRPLVSRTCTYKKTPTAEGEKEKEIPGIKLYDVTEGGEIDIGAVLMSEGWASPGPTPRPSPPRHQRPPFGDLGNSRVLGMLAGERCSSLPKDHKDDQSERERTDNDENAKDTDRLPTSKSLGSGMETAKGPLSVSNFDLTYSDKQPSSHINGSQENFLQIEKQTLEKESERDEEKSSLETLVPPTLTKTNRDEFKANMNRIDSHHSNLEMLGRSQHDISK